MEIPNPCKVNGADKNPATWMVFLLAKEGLKSKVKGSVSYSKKVTTHPWSTPQAIPLPNYPLQPVGKGLGPPPNLHVLDVF